MWFLSTNQILTWGHVTHVDQSDLSSEHMIPIDQSEASILITWPGILNKRARNFRSSSFLILFLKRTHDKMSTPTGTRFPRMRCYVSPPPFPVVWMPPRSQDHAMEQLRQHIKVINWQPPTEPRTPPRWKCWFPPTPSTPVPRPPKKPMVPLTDLENLRMRSRCIKRDLEEMTPTKQH